MNAGGVGLAVLSISGPGVQVEPDAAVAIKLAQQANDLLATKVHRRRDRYAGFAQLAMQDPAADELEPSVRDLGFVGAMVNGHTNGIYLDDPRYEPFWERMQALDVPLYIHPADSYVLPYVLKGCGELLKPTWEWTTETSTHFLRLLFAGVFDRYPWLKIILGHMGETLPFMLWRLDSRSAFIYGGRPLAQQTLDPIVKAAKKPLKIVLVREIHEGARRTLWEQLWNLPESAKSVLLIGHNPALQDLALELADTDLNKLLVAAGGKFPTGAMASFHFDGAWKALEPHGALLASFITPKSIAELLHDRREHGL